MTTAPKDGTEILIHEEAQYLASEKAWATAFDPATLPGGASEWAPWVVTADRDGNPILALWSPRRRVAIRILQHVPRGRLTHRMEHWVETAESLDGGHLSEMVISATPTEQSVTEARAIFDRWMVTLEVTPGPTPESCGSCRFWVALPEEVQRVEIIEIIGRLGTCRRFPPARPFTDSKRDLIRIDEGNWCGEWAARKAEPLPLDVCPTTGGEHVWLDTSTNDGPGRVCQKCGREGSPPACASACLGPKAR